MSYILDALKRADAERERGRVPGLHAHPMSLPAAGDEPRSGPPRWAVMAVAAVAGMVVAALAWRMGADANAPLPAAALPPPAVAETTAPPVSAVTAPAEQAPAPAIAPPLVVATPAARVPPPAIQPSPPATAKPRPAPVPTAPRAVAEPSPRAAAEPAAARAAETPAAPARSPIVALADLPASVRKQLPPLVVGGSIYSEEVASRFLILNGEVFHEGGKPAPDLVLERIEPKSAVLRFKDQRFRIGY